MARRQMGRQELAARIDEMLRAAGSRLASPEEMPGLAGRRRRRQPRDVPSFGVTEQPGPLPVERSAEIDWVRSDDDDQAGTTIRPPDFDADTLRNRLQPGFHRRLLAHGTHDGGRPDADSTEGALMFWG